MKKAKERPKGIVVFVVTLRLVLVQVSLMLTVIKKGHVKAHTRAVSKIRQKKKRERVDSKG